jgi:hypothetical protein
MGRYARHPYTSSLGDTPWTPEGDAGWVGVDMLHGEDDAGAVQPMYLARHENKRLRTRSSIKRKGSIEPPDFNPDFAGRFVGSGIFSNPNGEEVMLIAEAGKRYVWALQFGKDPLQINYGPGTPGNNGNGVAGTVQFVQYFDKVALKRFQTTPQPDLIWDGYYDNADPTHTFNEVTLSEFGLKLIPFTSHGEPFQDRVLLYNYMWQVNPWRDQVVATDAVNYSSYDEVFRVFRVNAGESDVITRVMGYYKGMAIVFKRRSIHMLYNFTLPDPFQAGQRCLSFTHGSIGNKFPLQVGREVYFLAEQEGIFKINEVIEEQIVVEPTPVSLPIQPMIDRIDWDSARLNACSAKLEEYAFFGVPINGFPTPGATGAAGNTAILVLNTATGQWESVPDWWADPGFRFERLLVSFYDGRRTVFALDYNGQAVYALYEGVEDSLNGNPTPIPDVFETRGYMLGDEVGQKRYQRAVIAVSTLDPQGTVTAITDGYKEEKEIGTITKDPTEFYVHGHRKMDLEPGDAGFPSLSTEPYREDYLIPDIKFVGIDFETYPLVNPLAWINETKVQLLGDKQRSLERFTIKMNGRWCAIRVEDTGLNCDILSVQVEGTGVQETKMKVA